MGTRTGVIPRKKSIQIGFTWNGGYVREKLEIAPTPANVKRAELLAKNIRGAISDGTFRMVDYFPDSPRAQTKTETKTFGDMCDLWLKTKGRLATKTQTQYRNALEVWKGLLGQDTPIDKLTHAIVAAKVGSTPWASAKLLNNYLICLRGVFKLTGRDMKIDDPMDGIENSKHQKTPPDPLDLPEMELVLTDMAERFDARVSAYFEFMFTTGLRPEEAIALKWDDIDWRSGCVLVRRARTAGEIRDLKTYNSRSVDLVSRALDAISTMRYHTEKSKDGFIFQNPVTGRPWHDDRSQRDHYWKPSLARCGIRYRRAYQTRHTYAANALLAGVNPTYISRQMGHTNARMLFEVYAKWIDGADRGRERAKMQELLSRKEPGHGPV